MLRKTKYVTMLWFFSGVFALNTSQKVMVSFGKEALAKKKKPRSADTKLNKKNIRNEGQLAPKKDYALESVIRETKDLRVLLETKTPSLTLEDLREDQIEALVDEKLDEEIHLAEQLLSLENSCDGTAPIRFRLADLNWEKAQRSALKAEEFNVGADNKKNYLRLVRQYRGRSIKDYERIVNDCQEYKDYPKVLYYLGKALVAVERDKEGATYFKRVIKDFPDSEWIADAWFSMGEYFFNTAKDVTSALRAYQRSADFPASEVYGLSVYKQGWCYINMGDWDLALDRFQEVIRASEDPKSQLDQRGRFSLKREGLRDYVRAYSHVGDSKSAFKNFTRVGGSSAVQKMMEDLGNWFIQQGKHREVVLVYRDLIQRNLKSSRLPVYQGRIVDAASRLGDKRATVTQAKLLTEYFETVRTQLRKKVSSQEQQKQIEKDIHEAEEIAENTLRRLATEYHQEARELHGAAQNKMFKLAYELYKHYLTVFPETKGADGVNYVFFMRFYYAEVLYRLEEFSEAAENYDRVIAMNSNPKTEKEKKVIMAAVEEAVRSYDELVTDMDKKNPPEISGTDPKPIPEIKQKLIDASKRYINYLGAQGDKIVEVRYKVARIFYTYNHFTEAAPAFNDIVTNHPSHEVACYSANLTLDIYLGLKNYDALEDAARAFAKSEKISCGKDERAKFAKIEQQASFQRIKSELEDKNLYSEAAKAYWDFYKRYPESDVGDKAVFNSAVNYDKSGKLEKANQVRSFFVEKFKDSPLVPDTLYNIAQSYERIVSFGEAAEYLEKFAKRYTQDKRSKDALYNAAIYRTTLHDYKGAETDRNLYLSVYKTDPEIYTVAFANCEANEEEAKFLENQNKKGKGDDKVIRKAWEDVHDCYYRYIQNNFYVKASTDLLCVAQFRRGEVMRAKSNYTKGAEAQASYLLKNWPVWQKEGLRNIPRCAASMADLQFRELEDPLKNYLSMKIAEVNPTDKGKKKFDASISAKTKTRDELIARYKSVVETGVADWALAALYQIGEAYRDSIDKLLAAPFRTKSLVIRYPKTIKSCCATN